VVLLALPSVLYVFDRPILAMTLGAKKAVAEHCGKQEVSL